MAGVEITDLTKEYLVGEQVFCALRNVSVLIPNGSFTVIVGKSGCGKTTLLRLLAGLEDKTAGQIRLNDDGADALHRRIGIMFQEHRLMPWLTVRENMSFSLAQRPDRKNVEQIVSRYLQVLGLERFQDAYPAQLSGGMAQRVALGRTLCYDPDIILMDEPFGALDYFTRKRMQQEIIDIFLAQKKTVIFVTHDVAEAVYLAQNIIIMDAGEVVRELSVELPYHRNPASPELLAIQSEILGSLSENHSGHNL
jgi:sulfonate transport system ATP-binding protein